MLNVLGFKEMIDSLIASQERFISPRFIIIHPESWDDLISYMVDCHPGFLSNQSEACDDIKYKGLKVFRSEDIDFVDVIVF